MLFSVKRILTASQWTHLVTIHQNDVNITWFPPAQLDRRHFTLQLQYRVWPHTQTRLPHLTIQGALFPHWGETQQEKQTSQILFIILQIDYLFYCSFKDRGEYLWSSKNQIEILWTWLWIYTFILCLGKLLHLLCNVFIFLLIN